MIDLVVIPHTRQASDYICALRNDPQVRLGSTQSHLRDPEEFYKTEFPLRYVTSSENTSFFIFFKGKKVGVIALEPTKNPSSFAREVSLFIEPQMRGKRIGTHALQEAVFLATQLNIHTLYATIKEDNTASKQLFTKQGFVSIGELRYQLNLVAPSKVTVIAEAGSNWHQGSFSEDKKTAFEMIEQAKQAGADVVKFQFFDPKKLYVENAGKAAYLDEIEPLSMEELFAKYQMPTDLLVSLKEKCDALGIEFLASSFCIETLLALDPFVHRHKIASYELTHTKLLQQAASLGKPVILSTGGASLVQIQSAVQTYQRAEGTDLTLMQCTAQYPADPSAMNIAALKQLYAHFQVPVGLSDHSRDPVVAPVLAVGYGASVIEKHFTLDRSHKGPDHFFALEPSELKQMVQAIRQAEQMAQSCMKSILPQEKDLYLFAQRAVQAIQPIEKGHPFIYGVNIDILRPGNQAKGIDPIYLDELEGKKAKEDIPVGSGIQKESVEW